MYQYASKNYNSAVDGLINLKNYYGGNNYHRESQHV